MSQIQTKWNYPTVEVSEDKRGPRTSCPPNMASELIGVDGSALGGIRPHPGFSRLPAGFGLGLGTSVLDARSFFVRTSTGAYTCGLVVKYTEGDGVALYKAFYWYNQPIGYGSPTELPDFLSSSPLVHKWDVVVWGQSVYFLSEGYVPVMLFPTYQTGVGPGDKPDNEVGLLADMTAGSSSSSSSGDDGVPDDAYTLDPGDYVFAFQFYDSVTGRKSQLSVIKPIRTSNFPVNTAAYTTSGGGSVAATYYNAWAYFDATVPAVVDKFDTIYMYRSVRVQGASGVFAAGILFLDNIQTITVDAGQVQRFYFKLQDKVLVSQKVFLERTDFDSYVPPAGAGLIYQGTMLLGSLPSVAYSGSVRPDPLVNFQIRWSTTTDPCPELFPAENYYASRSSTDQVHRFHQLGPNVIGFASGQLYLITQDSTYLNVLEFSQGTGSVNQNASDVVSDYVYFVSSRGLKAVDPYGQVSDMATTNYLFTERWKSNLDVLSACYDPTDQVFYVLNPYSTGQGEAVLLWLETRAVTELRDLPFVAVCRAWCSIPGSGTIDGQMRALFLTSAGQVYVADTKRVNLLSGLTGPANVLLGGNPAIGSRPVATVASVSTFTVTFTRSPGNLITGGAMWCYVLTGALAGTRVKVLGTTGLTATFDTNMTGLVAGDLIGGNAMYMRWVGAPVSLSAPDGTVFGYDSFRTKKVTGIRAAFSNVVEKVSALSSKLPFFRGLVYRGVGETPEAYGLVKDSSGTPTASIYEGPTKAVAAVQAGSSLVSAGGGGIAGGSLTVGLEVFVPTLDFRLLGVQVDGSIEAGERDARP